MKCILGVKQQMTQVYASQGKIQPVTVLSVGPCTVTQVRTKERDGYVAVQLGYREKKKVSKALQGHSKDIFSGRDGRGFRYFREVRQESLDGIERGAQLGVAQFSVGEHVTVIGTSKGRGFAGVVKRHHFHGHPTTHGHKDQERMPGSIGAGGNQHVFKGLRMAGRMGADRVTVKNLEIIEINLEQGTLAVKGAVPGARNGLVLVVAPGEFKAEKKSDEPASVGQEPQEVSA